MRSIIEVDNLSRSFGELVAVTAPQRIEVEQAGGRRIRRVADPLTTFKALRLRRDFGETAHIGALALATNRLESGADYPLVTTGAEPFLLCPGEEEQRRGGRCFHDAYVGAIDGRWRPVGGDYVATGQIAASVIDGGPARTMLDGTVIGSGDVSGGGLVRAMLMKPNTEDWRGWELRATDEFGGEIFTVPFASVLGKLH